MNLLDPFDLSGQEDAHAEHIERATLKQRQEVEDLKWFLSNKRGRRIAARLLERAGVFNPSFNTNALTMAFNEGARREGIRLLEQIKAHCPDRYLEMLTERD